MKHYITSNGQFHRSAPPPAACAPARLYVLNEHGEWVPMRGTLTFGAEGAALDIDPADLPERTATPGLRDFTVEHSFVGERSPAAAALIAQLFAQLFGGAQPPEPPPPPAPERRWYLCWVNRVTGEEGRTEGDGWPTRVAAEAAIRAFAAGYPDRVWWPVQESEASDD